MRLECKGKECEHYRKYYGVQGNNSSGFLPDFLSYEERCNHPSQMKIHPFTQQDIGGTELQVLKDCPLNNR